MDQRFALLKLNRANCLRAVSAIALLATVSSAARGQSASNDDIKSRARECLRKVGVAQADLEIRRYIRSGDSVAVAEGRAGSVYFDGSGMQMTYLKVPVSYEAADAEFKGSLPSESAIWEVAEGVCSRFEVPSGLVRKSMQRFSGGGLVNRSQPPTFSCYFEQKPSGYPCFTGNAAWVTLRQRDLKVQSVKIVSGWQFEPASVIVSASEAIDIARREKGGETHEWQAKLMYFANKDTTTAELRDLRRRKIQRLCYMTTSRHGQMMIEAKTGTIAMRFGMLGSHSKPIPPDALRSSADETRTGQGWDASNRASMPDQAFANAAVSSKRVPDSAAWVWPGLTVGLSCAGLAWWRRTRRQ